MRQTRGLSRWVNALDHAAFAGGVAAFEDHDDLELLVLHPILQLHELALQAQQLLEVMLAIHPFFDIGDGHCAFEPEEAVVVELHLDLFVKRVLEVGVDQLAHVGAVGLGHENPLDRPELSLKFPHLLTVV
jgi:hypothetical protein